MLLSPSQLAELTATSGVLNSANMIDSIFDRLEEGDAFQNMDEFFWALIQSEVKKKKKEKLCIIMQKDNRKPSIFSLKSVNHWFSDVIIQLNSV